MTKRAEQKEFPCTALNERFNSTLSHDVVPGKIAFR